MASGPAAMMDGVTEGSSKTSDGCFGRRGGSVEHAGANSPFLALSPLVEMAINEHKEIKSSGMNMVSAGGLVGKKQTDTIPNGVSVQASTPLRRSLRRAGSVDEDSLDRASRLVAKRNLEDVEGKSYNSSILNFPSKLLADNIKNVGISMGSDILHVQSIC